MGDSNPINRRQHERFRLQPMYAEVRAERAEAAGDRGGHDHLEGHAYDISEAGVRIELDEPLDPGESVAVELKLPGNCDDVRASASVVWVAAPDDDPGPRRMALRFKAFASTADRDRLFRYLGTAVERVAA